MGQHPLVIGHLQIEQRLVQALAPPPAKDRYRHQQLPRRRVSRQAPALAAGMENELRFAAEPRLERPPLAPVCRQELGQQVGRAAPRTQRPAGRGRSSRNHSGRRRCSRSANPGRHAGRQGQQVLHGNRAGFHSETHDGKAAAEVSRSFSAVGWPAPPGNNEAAAPLPGLPPVSTGCLK